MKLLSSVVSAAVIAVPMMFSTAVSAADGAEVFNKCKSCHGADAMGGMGDMAPRLAGQKEKYILNQFKLIKAGTRASGNSGMMKGAVQGVSDDDAAAVAKYLAAL